MEEKFTLKIKDTFKDMVAFQFYNSYYKMKGVMNIVISAGCLALYLSGYISGIKWMEWLLIFGALFFPIIYPLVLVLKAAVAAYGGKAKEPIQYTFSHEGINIFQNDNTLDLAWKDLFFVKETKSTMYIYITPSSALILPYNQIYGYGANIKNLLNKHMDNARIKYVKS